MHHSMIIMSCLYCACVCVCVRSIEVCLVFVNIDF